MQVGPGNTYVLRIGGFNDALSTLGDSFTKSNLNGMKFTTKYDTKHQNCKLY